MTDNVRPVEYIYGGEHLMRLQYNTLTVRAFDAPAVEYAYGGEHLIRLQ